ncbi:hypothetical protein [Ponticoccus alexandrii]|uniref:Uncharacterized protein n=1 Tax=Ponticoccus alexandrii TaxID=1943633 RepID=A0ABX7F8F5_9RHOB|nr:hypothetical protein [Ponticoccus alexandrii]ETA51046.2 hypothetical protein P279_16190 [Rhodobacteraceae bacterium PD-2]QRF66136.1 hypothetical protein GQA70_07355 [Ponticoccus alexandrii]
MKRLLFSTALALMAPAAFAAEPTQAMQDYMQSHIRDWAQDPVIVNAIAAQNAVTSGYAQARIDEMDTLWRAEVGTGSSALVDGVLMNTASDFLRMQVQAAGGTITEVFVMDAQGLNVAASAATSDYWQGDEAKYQESYGKGPGGVHYSEIAFDESSQTYQAQVSMTIVDPASGAAIGAMTVGINAEELM